MNDILPLAIHAFFRMNIIGENRSCYFIHQNMGVIENGTKVSSEIDAFVRDLNAKTLAAAIDAGQYHKYKKFKDIFQYDETTDNVFVPGLWCGTPPMGKVNLHYSHKMLELKSDIFNKHLNNKKMYCTIKDFAKRLGALWDAMKCEDFVLSFKNVLAMNTLELQVKQRVNEMSMNTDMMTKDEIRRRKSVQRPGPNAADIFNNLWGDVTSDILHDASFAEEDPNIEASVQIVIRNLLHKDIYVIRNLLHKDIRWYLRRSFNLQRSLYLQRLDNSTSDGNCFIVDIHRHIKSKSLFTNRVTSSVSVIDPQEIENRMNDFIKGRLSSPPLPEGRKFKKSDVETLFRAIANYIDENASTWQTTRKFKVDVLHYSEKLAVPKFKKMHENYFIESSPEALLLRKKKNYQKWFEIEMAKEDTTAEFCEPGCVHDGRLIERK